jgi:hypothetical protein
MTEIEQKAVEELVDGIGKFYNYQITQSDAYELAKFLDKKGYREQSETITFYKDPNIKDWAESEYAWCERPCDSNMSMRAIDKKGNIVGYASEHYWTWCDVKEVKKVSAIEFMHHFASKQSDTVKEFAEKLDLYLIKLFHQAHDSQKECEQHNGTVWESGWQRNDERMIIIQRDIQPFIRKLAAHYGKEEK